MVDFRQDAVDPDFPHTQESRVMKTEDKDSDRSEARSLGNNEESRGRSREERKRNISRRRRSSQERRRRRTSSRKAENHLRTGVDERRRGARIRRRSPRLRNSPPRRTARRRTLPSPKTVRRRRQSTPPRRGRRGLSANRKPRIRGIADRPQGVGLVDRAESTRRDRRRGVSPLRTRRREPTRVSTPARNRRRGEVNSSRLPASIRKERRGRRIRSPRRSLEKSVVYRGRNRRNDVLQNPRRGGIARTEDSTRERRAVVPRAGDSRRGRRGEMQRGTETSVRERRKDNRQARSQSQVRRSYERESLLPSEDPDSSFQPVQSLKPGSNGYAASKPLQLGPPSPISREEPASVPRHEVDTVSQEDSLPQKVRSPRATQPSSSPPPSSPLIPKTSPQPEWPLFVHVSQPEDDDEKKRHSKLEPIRAQKRKRAHVPKEADSSSKRKKITHHSERPILEQDKYPQELYHPKNASPPAYVDDHKYEIDKMERQNYYRSPEQVRRTEESVLPRLGSIPAMRKPPKPPVSWPAIRRPPTDLHTQIRQPSYPVDNSKSDEHNNSQQWGNDSTYHTLNGYRRTVNSGTEAGDHIRTFSSKEKSHDPGLENNDPWPGHQSNNGNVCRPRFGHRTVGKPEFSKSFSDYSDSESVDFSESETIKVIVQCKDPSPPRTKKLFPKQEPLSASRTEPIIIRPKVTGLPKRVGPKVIRPKITDSTVTSYFNSTGDKSRSSRGKCSIDIDRSLADIFSTVQKTIAVRKVRKKVVDSEPRDRNKQLTRVIHPERNGKVAREGYSRRDGLNRREGQQLKRGGLISRTRPRRVSAQRRGRCSGSRRPRRRR